MMQLHRTNLESVYVTKINRVAKAKRWKKYSWIVHHRDNTNCKVRHRECLAIDRYSGRCEVRCAKSFKVVLIACVS